jgi:hypothetical protein
MYGLPTWAIFQAYQLINQLRIIWRPRRDILTFVDSYTTPISQTAGVIQSWFPLKFAQKADFSLNRVLLIFSDPITRQACFHYSCSLTSISCSLVLNTELAYVGERRTYKVGPPRSKVEQFQRTGLWWLGTTCTISLSLDLAKHRNQPSS